MNVRTSIENLGARAMDGLGMAGDLAALLGQTLAGVIRGKKPPGAIAEQMYIIGNKSVLFVSVTLGFIGMVSVYQACLQLNRITGDLSRVGAQMLRILVQDMGPTLTALMLATRVGAGIAAEIGSMKVTEQIDALRMCGVTPVRYLVVPRFIACVVMMFAMSIFGIAIAFAAGGLTAYSSYGVNYNTFLDPSRVLWSDVVIGSIKALAYGMAIPVISGFCGLHARGSSEGVGWATTAAVIGSSFAIIVLDFIISGFAMVARGGGIY